MERPTVTQQRSVILETASPFTSLEGSWYVVRYPPTAYVGNPSPWHNKLRARSPNSYFHSRLLSNTEVENYAGFDLNGDNYVYEITGDYTDPLVEDPRLVPSVNLELVRPAPLP